MIPKAVYDRIPQGAKTLNQYLLSQSYPNMLNPQVATPEVRKLQVLCIIDRSCVLFEPPVQRFA